MLDRLGDDLDSGYGLVQWCRAQIEQSRRTGADENDFPLDLLARDRAGEHAERGE
jgi:hypothetical protein